MGNLNKQDPCVGPPIANLPRGTSRATTNIPERENDCDEVPDGLFNFFAWIIEGIPGWDIRPTLADATQEETDDAEQTWDIQDWWYDPWAVGSTTAYVNPEPESGEPVLPEADEIFADFIWDDWFIANGISDTNSTMIELETFEDRGGRALYIVESDTRPDITVVGGMPEFNTVIQEVAHGHCLTIVQHDSSGSAETPGDWSALRFTWSTPQREVMAQVWSSSFPFDDGPDGLIEDFKWYASKRPAVQAQVGNAMLSWNEPETPPTQPLNWQLGCLLLRGEQNPTHRQYWVSADTSWSGSVNDVNKFIRVAVYDLSWHEAEANDPEPGDPCGLDPGAPATGPASAVISSMQDVEILLTQELSGDDSEDESWTQPACGTVNPYSHGFHALLVVYKITGVDPQLTVSNSFSGDGVSGISVTMEANEEIEEVDIEVGATSFIEAFWNGNGVPDETYHVSLGASVQFNPDRRDAVAWPGDGWRGDDPDIVSEVNVDEDRIHNSGAAFVPFMSSTHEAIFIVRVRLVTP